MQGESLAEGRVVLGLGEPVGTGHEGAQVIAAEMAASGCRVGFSALATVPFAAYVPDSAPLRAP